jgi:bifunctional UDP-N-acetylglucosamine pyrophosphorylase/glucosamine-1-phosphate N-acetyltransferase/UDP-N-acetylglucosamine pyrophosphorylase
MCEPLAIVLAAGKGTRMKSELPKVLFPVCGRPMLEFVLDALAAGGVGRMIVVVGYRAELVQSTLDGRAGIECALQKEQLGTGHAVMACRDLLAGHDGPVLVVAGDSPMMQPSSIAALLAEYRRGRPACILGTAHKQDPSGLGRIVRDPAGRFLGIVEHKDATPEQLRITEVNMSYYVFDCRELLPALDHIRADNSQGEYYITDAPGVLVAQGKEVRALPVLQPCESLSINNVDELAQVETEMRRMKYEG